MGKQLYGRKEVVVEYDWDTARIDGDEGKQALYILRTAPPPQVEEAFTFESLDKALVNMQAWRRNRQKNRDGLPHKREWLYEKLDRIRTTLLAADAPPKGVGPMRERLLDSVSSTVRDFETEFEALWRTRDLTAEDIEEAILIEAKGERPRVGILSPLREALRKLGGASEH